MYVRPFPDVGGGGPWPVSTTGGFRPLWSADGRELFYASGLSAGALWRVPVERGATWKAGEPTKLFEGQYFVLGGGHFRHYDLAPDGQQFLMIKEVSGDRATTTAGIVVVQNWVEDVKRRVPAQ